MLQAALALIITSAVVAAVAILPALGIGGRLIPGYAFRARGEEARSHELFLLRRIAMMLYSLAVLLSGTGVIVYFGKESPIAVAVFCAAAALTVAFWVFYVLSGRLQNAAKAAKELSKEE